MSSGAAEHLTAPPAQWDCGLASLTSFSPSSLRLYLWETRVQGPCPWTDGGSGTSRSYSSAWGGAYWVRDRMEEDGMLDEREAVKGA